MGFVKIAAKHDLLHVCSLYRAGSLQYFQSFSASSRPLQEGKGGSFKLKRFSGEACGYFLEQLVINCNMYNPTN